MKHKSTFTWITWFLGCALSHQIDAGESSELTIDASNQVVYQNFNDTLREGKNKKEQDELALRLGVQLCGTLGMTSSLEKITLVRSWTGSKVALKNLTCIPHASSPNKSQSENSQELLYAADIPLSCPPNEQLSFLKRSLQFVLSPILALIRPDASLANPLLGTPDTRGGESLDEFSNAFVSKKYRDALTVDRSHREKLDGGVEELILPATPDERPTLMRFHTPESSDLPKTKNYTDRLQAMSIAARMWAEQEANDQNPNKLIEFAEKVREQEERYSKIIKNYPLDQDQLKKEVESGKTELL